MSNINKKEDITQYTDTLILDHSAPKLLHERSRGRISILYGRKCYEILRESFESWEKYKLSSKACLDEVCEQIRENDEKRYGS